MRIKEGFVLRKVSDQYVVIATGEASKDFHGMIKLNKVGADIWQALMDGLTADEIVSKLVKQYDEEEATIKSHVQSFMNKMEQAGFLANE